jgi:rhamnosyltransferase
MNFFNDVSSAIRRDYLLEHPFPDIFFAEDVEFAKQALELGKKIIFEPDSIVMHSHSYSIIPTYKRNKIDALYHKKYLGITNVPNLNKILVNLKFLVGRDFVEVWRYEGNLYEKIIALFYSPVIHFIEQIAQYRGSIQNKSEL